MIAANRKNQAVLFRKKKENSVAWANIFIAWDEGKESEVFRPSKNRA